MVSWVLNLIIKVLHGSLDTKFNNKSLKDDALKTGSKALSIKFNNKSLRW